MTSGRAVPKRSSNALVIVTVAGIALLALILLAIVASQK